MSGGSYGPSMPANEIEKARFRSFCDRYLIERAKTWPAQTDSEELEQAWRTIQLAERIYKSIEDKVQHLNITT